MKKTLIIFAPKGGYTEIVASYIKSNLDAETVKISGTELTSELLKEFTNIIIGTATLGKDTWNSEKNDVDTTNLQHMIVNNDFTGKKIALFGLGNAILYPTNFVDDLGIYASELESRNAKLIGFTPAKNYSFRDSRAIRGEEFCGLPLDNDTEADKTESRLNNWLQQISKEFE